MGTSSHRQWILAVGLPPWAGVASCRSQVPGTLFIVEPPVPSTTPTAEKPALSDAERAERLKLLAERLRNSEGLDHEALKQVEQLKGNEQ